MSNTNEHMTGENMTGENDTDLFEFLDTTNSKVRRSHYVRANKAEVNYAESVGRAHEELGEESFKGRFNGIPKSVMHFDKDADLMALVGDDEGEPRKNLRDNEHSGYATNLKFSTYNPTQARLFLDYYMKPGAHILDPFMGRGTRSVMTYSLGMSYTGFDTCKDTVAINERLLDRARAKHGDTGAASTLHLGDGTALAPYEGQENLFDGVFTCPPYYGIEQYSGAEGDLSHMTDDEFNDRMRVLFRHLHRLVKPSGKYRPDLHPVLMTVGTVRHGEDGIVDMDSLFQGFARDAGFVLHDKVVTENRAPGAGFTFRRNWSLGFVTKAHETTLVWLKR